MTVSDNVSFLIDFGDQSFNQRLAAGHSYAATQLEIRIDGTAIRGETGEFVMDDFIVSNCRRMLDSIELISDHGQIRLTYQSTPITLVLQAEGKTAIELWYDEPGASHYTIKKEALLKELIRSSEEFLKHVANTNPNLLDSTPIQNLKSSILDSKELCKDLQS